MASKQSGQHSSACSSTEKSSKIVHDSSRHRKRCDHKSRSSNQHSALRQLRKRVSHMVHEDRRHKHSGEKIQELQLPSCGCPNNCEAELEKLRKYINGLLHLLPKDSSDLSSYQLDHFVNNPIDLLSEAWITLGASHLRDLVSANLLAICARREQRDKKHSLSDKDAKIAPAVYRSSPPFLSLEDEFSENVTAGVRELWKRCLLELSELSEVEIQAVLSGQFVDATQRYPKSLEHSTEQAVRRDPSGPSTAHREVHNADAGESVSCLPFYCFCVGA